MATKVSINWIDHSGEKTRTQFYVPAVAGDGANWAALLTSIGLLTAAAEVASDCGHLNTTLSVETEESNEAAPSTVTAQREIAVKISYTDDVTGDPGSFTLPGPVVGLYPPTGVPGDYIPLDNAVFSVFIAVIEANMKSRAGNAITVTEGRLVGRNS